MNEQRSIDRVEKLRATRLDLIECKRVLESELTRLKASISGRRLSNNAYHEVVTRRKRVNDELQEINGVLSEVRVQISAEVTSQNSIRLETKEPRSKRIGRRLTMLISEIEKKEKELMKHGVVVGGALGGAYIEIAEHLAELAAFGRGKYEETDH